MGQRLSFTTGDREAARERVSAVFAPYDIDLSDDRPLDFHLDVVPAPRLTIGRMRYGVATTNQGLPMQSCYHLVIPMAGENSAVQNGVRHRLKGAETGVLFDPGHPLVVSWSADSWQRHVKVPTRLVESYAARLAGTYPGEAVRFDLGFDLRSGPGSALRSMIEFLDAEFGREDGVGANALACRELEGAFVLQLLSTIPNQLSLALRSSSSRPRRSKIADAIDYVDEHLQEEISIADLSVAADLSVRALQKGFQSVFGMSPIAYLRGERLERVRLELAGGAESVTAVAARWGFYHPGRFAQQYRERFGELPSHTAQHGRS